MRLVISTFLFSLFLAANLFSQTVAHTSQFGFQDIFKIKHVSSPRLSPDGQFVGFVVREADTAQNKWIRHLWRITVSTGETIQLTRGKNSEYRPRWSPDGSYLAFLSTRGEHPNIYKISNSGGEAQKLFDHPADIISFQFDKSGSTIYFLARDSLSKQEVTQREKKNDAYFYDQDKQPVHLWRYDLPSRTGELINQDNYSVREFALSPDQRQIAFVAAPSPREDDYLKREIYLLNLNSKTEKQLTRNGIAERQIKWSPDSRYLSFTSDASSQLATYYQDSIFLLDLQTGTIVDLLPDFAYQVFQYFWTRRGRDIYFLANMGVNTQLFRLNRKAGGVQQVTTGDHEIRTPHYCPELNRLVYTESTPFRPFDVRIATPKNMDGKLLSSMNSWLELVEKADYQTIHWKSPDGHQVEGILISPANAPQKPLPLIVQLHGGPESSYRNYFGSSWATYPQIWAAHGYVVFQPNYRGSTGYGDQVMRSIIGHYFEKDIDDIISGVDYLVAQGIADPAKMAVMGWSAGGHLTNWIVTHFQRFKAACSGAGGANWYSFYAQTDVQFIREIWHQGPPYSRQDYYMKKSPVTYVKQAKTPTLILCGEQDRRVPFPQSLEMYRGLKRYGTPTKFAAFPREDHGLREIRHQLYKMRLEFQWVEKHLFNRDWELNDLK